MKTVSTAEFRRDLSKLLDAAQGERILVMRNWKRSVVLVGVENYDDEDWHYTTSPDFWRMIESRRREGKLISLAQVKRRLGFTASKRPAKKRGSANGRQRAVKKRTGEK